MNQIKLYHYLHCPYCIRVRMAFGYLKISYESKVLPYEDEQTPIALTGVKMLPIVTHVSGISMNESLEIIKHYDTENKLSTHGFNPEEVDKLVNKLGKNVHSLCMPHWIYTKEFSESSRKYFQVKKEKTKGPFSALVKNRKEFEAGLVKDLEELEKSIQPFYQSDKFSIKDIMLASHIWGLYILPEFQFSEKIHFYLQRIKELCNFNYHQNLWDEN